MHHETPEQVQYLFGSPELTRVLTFTKADRTPSFEDKREDFVTRAVALAILRRLNATGTWPRGGGVQH